MADTSEFFNTVLPERLKAKPDLISEIGAVYFFDIEGAGQWTVDLTTAEGAISEGAAGEAGCTVTAAKADFEGMLDNPSSAMMLFMANKLKVSDVNLGLKLQKLLSA